MGSNVVYNENSKTWVAKGSRDDTTNASTSTNKNYGKSAHEVKYDKAKEEREASGIQTIESKEGESAEEYRARLNKTRSERFANSQQEKNKEDVLTDNVYLETYSKMYGISTPYRTLQPVIKDGKTVGYEDVAVGQSIHISEKRAKEEENYRQNLIQKHTLKDQRDLDRIESNDELYLSYDFEKESTETIDYSDTAYDYMKAESQYYNYNNPANIEMALRDGEKKANYVTSSPVLSGTIKGAKNLAMAVPYAIGLTAVSVFNPVAGVVIGGTASASYGYTLTQDIAEGKYYRNPEAYAQLGTELVGFTLMGKGIGVGQQKIHQKIWNYKLSKSNKASTDPNWKLTVKDFKVQTTYVRSKAHINPKTGQIIYDTVAVKKVPKGYKIHPKNPQTRAYKTNEGVKIQQNKISAEYLNKKGVWKKVEQKPRAPQEIQTTFKDPVLKPKLDPQFKIIEARLIKEAKAIYPKLYPKQSHQKYLDSIFKKINTQQKAIEKTRKFQDQGTTYKMNLPRSNPNSLLKNKKGQVLLTKPKPSVSTEPKIYTKPSNTHLDYTKPKLSKSSPKQSGGINSPSSFDPSFIPLYLDSSKDDNSNIQDKKAEIINKIRKAQLDRNKIISDIKDKISISNDTIQEPSQKINSITDVKQKTKVKTDQTSNQITQPVTEIIKTSPKKDNKRSYKDKEELIETLLSKSSSDKDNKKNLTEAGYNILVKKKGKWEQINLNPMSKKEALRTGSIKVDSSESASFKLIKTNKKIAKDKMFSNPNLSKFRNKDGVYIERRKHRIDSVGEKKGITYKGLAMKGVKL